MLCSHISSTASCHNALEPSVVRVSFGADSSALTASDAIQPAGARSIVGQRIANHIEHLAAQIADTWHEEVTLGPVDYFRG